MTKKSRRILFYLGVLIFLIASTIAILDAQGYKYSFDKKKFVRTGAFSLRANENANVFVDDELKGSTSFFGNAFGMDQLLPGTYTVRLQRDGYSPWQKVITVQEGFVTDFPHVRILPTENPDEVAKLISDIEAVFLDPNITFYTTPTPTPVPKKTVRPVASPTPSPSPLPAEPFFVRDGVLYWIVGTRGEILGENVEGFMLSESRRKILWWTSNELWVMWLTNTDYQPYMRTGDKQLITRLATPILQAAWYRGEDHIVLDSAGYKIVEIDKRGGTNIIKF
jgi:hypothetical protein